MKPLPTPEEALAIFIKRREKSIAAARAWKRANPDKARENSKERYRKMKAGYLAAKNAGLVE